MKIAVEYKVAFLAIILSSCGTAKLRRFAMPYTAPEVRVLPDNVRISGGSSLKQNRYGLWELYLEGSPLELGLKNGALTDSIYKYQEKVFFEKVKELVPSEERQRFLRVFLGWYNRKLPQSVVKEYREEIYGLSRYSSDSLNFIAPEYARSLYLHGAHDIGHAMQDLAMVGCTSFAAWGNNTEDGQLLIARNFDFYAGDEFAKNKVIAFVKPDSGHAFMSFAWPGMIGVVSGMNTKGLTVSINAAKSSLPLVARTPVSLLTREILQYAANIEEAIAIAEKRRVFVSESILIGSAADQKAILIEVSPKKTGIYEVENSSRLVCSNHFQSSVYKADRKNLKHKEESHSLYRFDRMTQLLNAEPKVNVDKAIAILRNTDGMDDASIGFGNEKSLNQLLAHHGIVFRPSEQKVWVSAHPYQLGAFVAYDLNEIFSSGSPSLVETETRGEDPFLKTGKYQNYERYKVFNRHLDRILKEKSELPDAFFDEYVSLNPDFWLVYYKSGVYFMNKKQKQKAAEYFKQALKKEITTLSAKREIEKKLCRMQK